MRWQIGDKYIITSDATCFTVLEVREYGTDSPKVGQTYEKALTYHGTLEQACQSVLNREIMLSTITTMNALDLVEVIRHARNMIIQAVRETGKTNEKRMD